MRENKFGKFLDASVQHKNLSIQELSRRTGIMRATIYRHMRGDTFPRTRDRESYARGLGFISLESFDNDWNFAQLDAKFVPRYSATGSASSNNIVASGDAMPAVFNLDVAASGWTEPSGTGLSENPRGTWFIIGIAGESMMPRWDTGDKVMFHKMNLEEDSPAPGVDYVFVRSDGYSTFKRLDKIDDETLHLKPLNPKHRKGLTVSKQELVMVAEARWKVVEPPPL